MIFFYYGSDSSILNIRQSEIRRRNMAFLSALSTSSEAERIYAVYYSSKIQFLKNWINTLISNHKIVILYYTYFIPLSFFGINLSYLNNILIRIFYFPLSFKLRGKQVMHWCYWPNGYKQYKIFKFRGKLIFDSDHNIVNDPNNIALSEVELHKKKALLSEIAKKANIIISGSRSMLLWFKNENILLSLYYLPNGVFYQSKEMGFTPKKKTQKVVYCGIISNWVKTEWLFRLIENNPLLEFHIIGKDYKTEITPLLKEYNNVTLHGFLPLPEANKIIETCDVAIALYREGANIDGSSMKILDYLMQNKYVVTNRFHEHLWEDYNGLIHCADTYEDFEKQIRYPSQYNYTQENIQQFLQRNTWQTLTNQFINSIK